MRGNFVWHELMTTDTQAASSFYPRVTGWKTRPWEHDSSYTLFESAGAPMGGLMNLPEDARSMGAPPSWLPYIGTTDIAGTVAHAQRLGGRVLKGVSDVPNVGQFAVLADPQGATFAVMQSSQPAPAPASSRPGVGDFSWHELATTDHRAAFDFYGELFGWRKGAGHDMGPLGIYQIFTIGGKEAGGMFNKNPDMPSHWLSYVNVRDADAAARAAVAAGGKVVNGPMDVPGGDRIAQIRDQQGGIFAVHSYAQPAVKPAPAPAQQPKAAAQPMQPAQPKPAARPTQPSQPKPAARPMQPVEPKAPETAAAAAPRKAAKRRPAARKSAKPKKRAGASRRRAPAKAVRKTARKAARKVARAAKRVRRAVRRALPKRRASARKARKGK